MTSTTTMRKSPRKMMTMGTTRMRMTTDGAAAALCPMIAVLPLPRRDRPLDWINTGSVPQRDSCAGGPRPLLPDQRRGHSPLANTARTGIGSQASLFEVSFEGLALARQPVAYDAAASWRGARMGPSPAPRRLERRERISRTPLSCLPYAECSSRDSRTVRAEGGDRRGSPRPGETLSGRRSKRLESVPSTLPGDRQPSAPVVPVLLDGFRRRALRGLDLVVRGRAVSLSGSDARGVLRF